MGLIPTIVILLLALLLGLYANWISRKPPEIGKVRLLPYNGIQFLCLIVICLMIAHLISLLTGTPLKSRFLS